MKKLLATMMALAMIVTLSQCKKQNEENEENTAKVRISCTIPINKDGKTDFTNILNGEVNWSAETERIYLALPYSEENHQIVVLTSTTNTGGKTLTFEGSVEKGLLQNGIHEIWYMGRSQNSKLLDDKVTGSIAEQSGSKDDLGYHHIAKASVNINVVNGIPISMTFEGKFESLMAIAHLDLTNVAGLSGEAVVGTDYSLEYIDGLYRLKVTGDKDINITGKENKNESYVVLFPTNEKDVVLNSDSNKKMVFHNGIKQNTLYKENDNKPLIWELPEHECVDLGLHSGVKWATCNIGAGSPEAYGKYYAWGETEEPLPLPAGGYVQATCGTYNKRMSDISGHETYDAATANWGKGWRIPTKAECEELMNEEYCTWSWIDNGYLVTSKINGNYIFLPAAGYKSGSTVEIHDGGVYGTYSCSTPAERGNDDDAEKSYTLGFKDKTKAIARIYRENGRVVRPVTGGGFKNPAAQYAEVITAEVSEITEHTAVCGGNVTVDKYSQVKERGVCWSTSQEPTIEDINDNKIECVQGEGEYTVTLTRLAPETVYYVRAYATTDAGTSYGIEVSFNTPKIGNNNYEYNFSNMGSHAVDLGLPSGVLWSDCNIGAEWAVEQNEWPNNIYGNYFMWACNTSSTSFGADKYPEYADNCDFNYTGNINYDAATNLWGGNWRTPTKDDFNELLDEDNCTWEYVTKDGINCLKFTSKHNGKSIYLPFSGCYDNDGNFTNLGNIGWYLMTDYVGSEWAPLMRLTEKGYEEGYTWAEYVGSSVRPIIGPIPAK